MKNKIFFLNWLRLHWNNLVDHVALKDYQLVKEQYFKEVSEHEYLTKLSVEDDVYKVEDNAILLLIEKWLRAKAAVHDPEKKHFYHRNYEVRMALMQRFLFNEEEGLFENYHLVTKTKTPCLPLHQFYLYWLNLSKNQELAKSLLPKIKLDDPQLFVVFMGLRRLGLIIEANEIGKKIGMIIDDYMPLISTNTGPFLEKGLTPKAAIKMIKESGFEAYDHSMVEDVDFYTHDNYLENARELKKYADKIGIVCNQTHAVFPVIHPSLSKEESSLRTIYTKRILTMSKILGAKHCIVHPINFFNEQDNYDYYQQYLPLAHELDIKIATENMFNWEDGHASLAACSNHDNFKALCDLVDDSHFVACVDLGHAELEGLHTSAVEMIDRLGHYVEALHIHDNNLRHDQHYLPTTGGIDFALILDALARINYQGDITFEANNFIMRMPFELHQVCLDLMYQLGIYLRDELLIRRKAQPIK